MQEEQKYSQNTEPAGRILVVDDETEIVDVFMDALQPHFAIVETACNGREALDKHSKNPADVIIADLKMPIMNGLDLLVELRIRADDTPFIIVTGFADLEASILALRNGAFDFFKKPFDSKEIVNRTKEAYVMRRTMNAASNDVAELIKAGKLPSSLPPSILAAARHVALIRRLNAAIPSHSHQECKILGGAKRAS